MINGVRFARNHPVLLVLVVDILFILVVIFVDAQKQAAAAKVNATREVVTAVGAQLVQSGFKPVQGQQLADPEGDISAYNLKGAYTAVTVQMTNDRTGEIHVAKIYIKLVGEVWEIGCANNDNFSPLNPKDPKNPTMENVDAFKATRGC